MLKLLSSSYLALAIAGFGLAPEIANAESLNDALAWSYNQNPDLIAARAGVRQALEGANIANAAARPRVNISAQYGRNYAQYVGNWQSNDQLSASVSASLLLYDGGNTGLATDAALARTQAANYQLLAQEQQVLLSTVSAYFDVLRDRNLVASSQNNINTLRTRLNSVRVSYDAGAATITEVAQTEASVEQARANLASSQANLARSEVNYRALTGHNPGQLQAVKNLPSLPSSLGEAEQIGVASSPLVLAAVANERASQYDLRRAKNARAPQVNLNAGATRNNALDGSGFSDSANLGVSVNVPLYNGGQISAAARQAEAALEGRSAETQATRMQVQQNVANAWAQLQNANSAVGAMQQVVQAQELADEGAEVEYEIGSLTVTDRLDAEQNLIDARSSLLSAQYQRQFAVYQVLAAMGRLTIEGMGLNIPTINPLASPSTTAPQSQAAKDVEQVSDRWSKP